MTLLPHSSDNDLRLAIFFAEFGRITPLALAELTIEVAQRVEAATVADLCNRVGGIHESARSIAQTDVQDIVREILARAVLEVAAEGCGRHADQVSQLLQADLVLIMLIDVVLDFQHTTALALQIDLGIG